MKKEFAYHEEEAAVNLMQFQKQHRTKLQRHHRKKIEILRKVQKLIN